MRRPPRAPAVMTSRPDEVFRCEFCEGHWRPARNENGEPIAVLHTTPVCPTFHRLSPERFVHACNRARVAALYESEDAQTIATALDKKGKG